MQCQTVISHWPVKRGDYGMPTFICKGNSLAHSLIANCHAVAVNTEMYATIETNPGLHQCMQQLNIEQITSNI